MHVLFYHFAYHVRQLYQRRVRMMKKAITAAPDYISNSGGLKFCAISTGEAMIVTFCVRGRLIIFLPPRRETAAFAASPKTQIKSRTVSNGGLVGS